MKRVILAIVSTVAALVLLLSFKSHSLGATPVALPSVVRTTSATSSGGSSGTSTPTATTPAAPAPTSTKTYTGTAADTRYGPVQVEITVRGGKVTAAQAVEYPQNDPRDQEINSFAVPQLEQETVSVGSANIDTVSGATYTSDGYLASLQSALDQAGLS